MDGGEGGVDFPLQGIGIDLGEDFIEASAGVLMAVRLPGRRRSGRRRHFEHAWLAAKTWAMRFQVCAAGRR